MYPKFIAVHAQKTGKEVFINVANISVVTPLEDGYDYRRIYTMDNDYTDVIESYDDLKALIQDCGCLIHKADPRLDMTHPLSMDDLKGMVDEPVWNSNTLKWMLIHRFVDADKPIVWLVSSGGQFKAMTVYDLIKTPLYRMCK